MALDRSRPAAQVIQLPLPAQLADGAQPAAVETVGGQAEGAAQEVVAERLVRPLVQRAHARETPSQSTSARCMVRMGSRSRSRRPPSCIRQPPSEPISRSGCAAPR